MNPVIRQDFFSSATIIQAEPLMTILPKGCNIVTDMVIGKVWRGHNSNFRFAISILLWQARKAGISCISMGFAAL